MHFTQQWTKRQISEFFQVVMDFRTRHGYLPPSYVTVYQNLMSKMPVGSRLTVTEQLVKDLQEGFSKFEERMAGIIEDVFTEKPAVKPTPAAEQNIVRRTRPAWTELEEATFFSHCYELIVSNSGTLDRFNARIACVPGSILTAAMQKMERKRGTTSGGVCRTLRIRFVEWHKQNKDKLPPFKDKNAAPSPLNKVVEAITEHVKEPVSVGLDEAAVRRIVREEIEAIFGPIEKASVTSTEVKVALLSEPVQTQSTPTLENVVDTCVHPVVATPVKAKMGVIKPAPLVTKAPVAKETQKKIKIFIFGLKNSQLQSLHGRYPKCVSIEGYDTFNSGNKDAGKRYDQVYVTRFSNHSSYETIRSLGNNNVTFISGGVTMLHNAIVKYLKSIDVMPA